MKTLRITGVPEHFNFPWKKVIASQPFLKNGIELKWTDESRGSGQMNKALREDQTDIAILLTESFLKDFEAGNPSKMIGYHVKSPLIWGIHIDAGSPVTTTKEIEQPKFLISREGSGSQLMAFELAQKEDWKNESLKFKVINNLVGALEVMHPEDPEMFLWEKYTTKPWVDSNQIKRIGEVASPWPCFVIAASNSALKEFGEIIFELRQLVYEASNSLQKSETAVLDIADVYKLKAEDVHSWISQTEWETEAKVSKSTLESAISKMVELKILSRELIVQEFLTIDHLTLLS
jgi:hypothetical protein